MGAARGEYLHRSRHSGPGSAGSVATAILVAALSGAAGCQFTPAGAGGNPGDRDGGDPGADAGLPPPIDGDPTPDAPPPGPGVHLLLTEVKSEPDSSEFIEIFNPLTVPVELEDYFLADHPAYAQLPQHVEAGTEPLVGNREGIVRFPPGSIIPAGGVAVIAMDEAGFSDAFGGLVPEFTVVPAPDSSAADMQIVANGNVPMQVDDGGEAIVLFHWDTETDLVTDVDIVVAGEDVTGENDEIFDKTGVMVEGPDADAVASTYVADSATMQPMEFRSGFGGSHKRIVLEDGSEIDSGGNGADGHDETSEDTRVTWEQVDDASAPTPGNVPSSLRP